MVGNFKNIYVKFPWNSVYHTNQLILTLENANVLRQTVNCWRKSVTHTKHSFALARVWWSVLSLLSASWLCLSSSTVMTLSSSLLLLLLLRPTLYTRQTSVKITLWTSSQPNSYKTSTPGGYAKYVISATVRSSVRSHISKNRMSKLHEICVWGVNSGRRNSVLFWRNNATFNNATCIHDVTLQ